MKVRFGVGLGPLGADEHLAAVVDRLEELRLDSLWFSEQVSAPQVDPVVGQAFAVARTARLKVGTGVAVLPGRHPVLVAKQLASLARLAPGRVLPVFGLQPARAAERAWFPVPEGRRGAVFDEALLLVRRLLTEERVTSAGEFFPLEEASIGPLPAKPLDLWLGGSAPAGLPRVGRLGDGWLGSFLTPGECAAAVATIQRAAAEAGRTVDPEHFGISVPVAAGEPDARLLRGLAGRRPDVDPRMLVPAGWAEARRLLQSYVDAGLSKFVVRPASPGTPWLPWLDEFAAELVPLQT
ncbi:probable F420-dependent oxidoreductase, MSMEG_3544 family [Trujillonella endophytica]|uniref:Probable F420-dependent oxidoreductase, MSMEG_3544 family n=2 Tax=Trujillonella endophytica TaxID=673521 RepID=A0A1H8SFZ7_9ACTN|nr:probable F420-dependent oxidoreductase, MSMEG_3544 family [Trujillella endophytica]